MSSPPKTPDQLAPPSEATLFSYSTPPDSDGDGKSDTSEETAVPAAGGGAPAELDKGKSRVGNDTEDEAAAPAQTAASSSPTRWMPDWACLHAPRIALPRAGNVFHGISPLFQRPAIRLDLSGDERAPLAGPSSAVESTAEDDEDLEKQLARDFSLLGQRRKTTGGFFTRARNSLPSAPAFKSHFRSPIRFAIDRDSSSGARKGLVVSCTRRVLHAFLIFFLVAVVTTVAVVIAVAATRRGRTYYTPRPSYPMPTTGYFSHFHGSTSYKEIVLQPERSSVGDRWVGTSLPLWVDERYRNEVAPIATDYSTSAVVLRPWGDIDVAVTIGSRSGYTRPVYGRPTPNQGNEAKGSLVAAASDRGSVRVVLRSRPSWSPTQLSLHSRSSAVHALLPSDFSGPFNISYGLGGVVFTDSFRDRISVFEDNPGYVSGWINATRTAGQDERKDIVFGKVPGGESFVASTDGGRVVVADAPSAAAAPRDRYFGHGYVQPVAGPVWT